MKAINMINAMVSTAAKSRMSHKTLEEQLEYNQEQSRALEERKAHKDLYSNPYSKEVGRLKAQIELEKLPITVESYVISGQVLINKRFIYVLSTGSWRVKGKNKWYRSKNPTHFVNKYVLKKKEK